jgi:hypothetical protein
MRVQRLAIVSMRMGREGELGERRSALGHRGIRTANLLTRSDGEAIKRPAAHRARVNTLANYNRGVGRVDGILPSSRQACWGEAPLRSI